MWIVRLALRRPYTIAVAVILIFLAGFLCMQSMLVDIFPAIDIPVVSVIWSYPGLPAIDMERRVILGTERGYSTSVNGIKKIESSSIQGIGLIRIFFEDGTDIGAAIAQIAATSSSGLRSMPPGMQPPMILQFNASNVPVAQLTLFSDTLQEEQISDYAFNFLRSKLFTIPGLSIPAPYGGKSRQINIDVSPETLNAKNLSPWDVVAALNSSNIILPAGTARIGNLEYNVTLNSSPDTVAGFEKIPLKVVGGAGLTLGDVAKVSDSFADQTQIVRVNGKRSSYLSLLKKSSASTLDVINRVKTLIPELQELAPKGFNMRLDFDQSVFVNSAITSVLREALISGVLVSLMILLFLGSWSSVIVVSTSIPAAIFVALIGLKLTGNTINIMTLGGLSLAIGMLVDDATVTVENIHRNRQLGLPLTQAILIGAEQIALPAIMATLAICIVFFPVVLLTGPARFLFVPMALSVVFSMLASYILSRTLVPLLSRMLFIREKHVEGHGGGMFPRFNHFFDRLQEKYMALLALLMKNRGFTLWVVLGFVCVTLFIPFFAGTDFFPSTDTGLMKLHFRAPPGTRIEATERMVAEVENRIRKIIPEEELVTINSFIGIPTFFNLAFVQSDNAGSMDAEISVALGDKHHPTTEYMKKIREDVAIAFPAAAAYFQPADIISQVLNFGLSAPIDIQFDSSDTDKSYSLAKILMQKMKAIPGVEDIALKQIFDYPSLHFNVDRLKAAQVGISQRDVASSMLIALSSSSLVSPSYFLNPANNVNYNVAVKVPLEKLSNVNDLLTTPVTSSGGLLASTLGSAIQTPRPSLLTGSPTQRLGNLSTLEPMQIMNSISHQDVQRVVNVTASAEGRDLGGVVSDINKAIRDLGPLPPGMKVTVRGQPEVMHETFSKLGLGLVISMLLVYLLMVVLFQSWLDPFIVMVAVPGALTGILWILFITGTTINVESFMGAVMAVGIAASNAILMVSFANDVRIEKNLSAIEAALEAAKSRLRPVMMTALAMIIGMTPAALAMGEGGEQNAPLGRAVIGGLIVATLVTLLVVPIIYSLLRTGLPTKHMLDERLRAEEGNVSS